MCEALLVRAALAACQYVVRCPYYPCRWESGIRGVKVLRAHTVGNHAQIGANSKITSVISARTSRLTAYLPRKSAAFGRRSSTVTRAMRPCMRYSHAPGQDLNAFNVQSLAALRSGATAVQVHSDMGRIVIRPMHREHIFETALLLTEAFLVDRNPPTFPWMM